MAKARRNIESILNERKKNLKQIVFPGQNTDLIFDIEVLPSIPQILVPNQLTLINKQKI